MQLCLHTANIHSRADVCSQQFAITAGLWHSDRMRLKLKTIRTERHLTIDQLADLTGISRAHISLLENGKRQPSADALQSFASALGVRVTELIDEGDMGDDLATIINVIAALDPDQRKAVLLDASSRLKKRGS
jgi:transcriptional regulator with XRE-family HTH domain